MIISGPRGHNPIYRKLFSQHPPPHTSNFQIPQSKNLHQNTWHSEHELTPEDYRDCMEDLEARLLFLPDLCQLDRLKIITAGENLATLIEKHIDPPK